MYHFLSVFCFQLHYPLIFLESVSYVLYLELQKETSSSEKNGFIRISVLAAVLTGRTFPTARGPTAQILHTRLLITVAWQIWIWALQIVLGENQCRIFIALWRAPGWKWFQIPTVILGSVGCAVVWGRKPWVFAGLTLLTLHFRVIYLDFLDFFQPLKKEI